MIYPLVECINGSWKVDVHASSAVLVPVLSLGRRMVATPAAHAGTFTLAEAAVAAGGPALRPTRLYSELFEAEAMIDRA